MWYLDKNGSIWAKAVAFWQKWWYSGKCCCIRQSGCFRENVVLFGQGGSIRAKVDVFGQKWLQTAEVVVFV